MERGLLEVPGVLSNAAENRVVAEMTLKELEDRRIALAAESRELEARLKDIRHQLVDVCDAIEKLRERKAKTPSPKNRP